MVEVLEIDEGDPDIGVLRRSAEVIGSGDLVIYPTETVYGLAGDATSDEAVARVFEKKSRPLERPISVAVDSLSMAYQVGKLSLREENLIQKFLPGPLTILVEARPYVSGLLTAGGDKVGVRIPDHRVALGLIEAVGGPITSTSANLTGQPAPREVRDSVRQLGEYVELALDAGRSPGGEPSTVVDVVGEKIEIIRKGPISRSSIESALK